MSSIICSKPQVTVCCLQILDYEKTASAQSRQKKAKMLYDKNIYAEMLAMAPVSDIYIERERDNVP